MIGLHLDHQVRYYNVWQRILEASERLWAKVANKLRKDTRKVFSRGNFRNFLK